MRFELRMAKFIVPWLVLFGLAAGKVYGAPQKKCTIHRGAWCVAEGPSEIALHLSDGELRWKIFGGLDSKRHFEIVESSGCAESGFSKSVSVLNINGGGKGGGVTIAFDLEINSSCLLHVVVPSLANDRDMEMFYLAFSSIRPCKNLACDGGDMVKAREYVLGRVK